VQWAILRGGLFALQVFGHTLRPEFSNDPAHLVLADFGESMDFATTHAG
jgi:hypothetical protein